LHIPLFRKYVYIFSQDRSWHNTAGGVFLVILIINRDKSEILEALLQYANSNTDVVDCILAAVSSPEKVIISFDKDFDKLNAISETI